MKRAAVFTVYCIILSSFSTAHAGKPSTEGFPAYTYHSPQYSICYTSGKAAGLPALWEELCAIRDPAAEDPYARSHAGNTDTVERAPEFDVPVVVNNEVERFIRYFQTRGRPFFVKWLERSRRYLPLLKEILYEMDLPEDLAYLALIESGFNPHARSRANAVGVWQFMAWTARKYGLRVDWWIDERRDPEKATYAAARYLRDLYGRFGSWHLAAAGYNGGEGRIRSAIRRHKTDDFWKLASYRRPLRKETRDYIPKYIAAMMIAKDPGRYGFTELNYMEPVSYDKVPVPYPTDIKVIAKAAGTTVEEIRRLNPELRRWFTPPDYPDYQIKIPEGRAEVFKKNMSRIPRPERLRFRTHRVRRGESLWVIARRYRTPIRAIMYLNNIKNPRRIRAGSTIVVPVRAEKTARRRSATPPPNTYTVRKGDTLWEISRRFGVELERILEWNDLPSADRIRPGQRIYLKEALLDRTISGQGLN